MGSGGGGIEMMEVRRRDLRRWGIQMVVVVVVGVGVEVLERDLGVV